MRKLLDWLIPLGALVGVGLIFTAVINLQDIHVLRLAHAQGTVLGPTVYPFASITAAQTILPPNATRHSFQICNESAGQVLWVAPLGTPPTATGLTGIGTTQVTPSANGAGSVGIPVATGGGVITCFSPPANAPAVGQGWQAFAAGAAPVSVYEWP